MPSYRHSPQKNDLIYDMHVRIIFKRTILSCQLQTKYLPVSKGNSLRIIEIIIMTIIIKGT